MGKKRRKITLADKRAAGHKPQQFKCVFCGHNFDSRTARKNHQSAVHYSQEY